MKKLLISLIFLSCFQVLAGDKLICSSYYLFKYKDLVPKAEYDKVKHCSYSCILAKKCGKYESYTVGYIKELADLMGMGEPDWADIAANKKGIKLAKRISHINKCLPSCRKLYPESSN